MVSVSSERGVARYGASVMNVGHSDEAEAGKGVQTWED